MIRGEIQDALMGRLYMRYLASPYLLAPTERIQHAQGIGSYCRLTLGYMPLVLHTALYYLSTDYARALGEAQFIYIRDMFGQGD